LELSSSSSDLSPTAENFPFTFTEKTGGVLSTLAMNSAVSWFPVAVTFNGKLS